MVFIIYLQLNYPRGNPTEVRSLWIGLTVETFKSTKFFKIYFEMVKTGDKGRRRVVLMAKI